MEKNEKKVGMFDEGEARRILMERARAKAVEEKANVNLVEEVRRQSIQPRAEDTTGRTPGSGPQPNDMGSVINQGISFFFQEGNVLPRWWSPARDRALSDFWKSCDVMSGAMYAMVSKMATIPWRIEPRDKGINSHFIEAERYERNLHESAEYGAGWGTFIEKQMESLLGQDNGRFMEIIDMSSNKLAPLQPPAISVAHLDPSRCTRTSDPDYPVIYLGKDGKQRALHWTRVAFNSQMPSEKENMYGVGICAVSRSASYGQNMLDMSVYKQEQIGSRPFKGILVTKGGLDPEVVGKALEIASQMTDDRGNTRYSLTPIVGSSDLEEAGIDVVSLSALPQGFNEETWTYIAMAAIALAFGVDARELWPMQQAGATKADAVLSHIKQRGKGPGHIIAETERMFNMWFLPRHLRLVFDFQDDAQDRQQAEIQRERALARKANLELGVTDIREERQNMVTDGSITAAQFKDMELADGRLPDGKPLDTLFFREEDVYKEILTLNGISNPTDIYANDPAKVLKVISTQRSVALKMLSEFQGEIRKRQATESLAALDYLARLYKEFSFEKQQEEREEQMASSRDDPEEGQREESLGPPSETDTEHSIGVVSPEESRVNSQEGLKQLNIFRKRH